MQAACERGRSSIFVSGIDPGWCVDLLPLVRSGVCSRIDEIRTQEIFDLSTYDQPDALRNLIGFGQPLTETPPMLQPFTLEFLCGAMLRVLADGLGVVLDEIEQGVERRPLEAPVDVAGMGRFEAGTQGAFRFQVRGIMGGEARLVVDHVSRIVDDIAPDWPRPPGGQRGCYRVIVEGSPRLEATIELAQGRGNPADAGNATAAARVVNAIPAVCDAAPGLLSPLDLPLITGRGLL